MELWELIEEVRTEINDEASELWHDKQVTRYLNDAQRDLVQFSKELSRLTVAVSASAETVPRPAALLLIKEMYYEVGDRRYPLEVHYGIADEIVTSSIPQDIYIVGSDFYLVPIPSQAGNLVIIGVSRPTAMSESTDEPTIADADSLLITYAAWKCMLVDGNRRAQSYADLYQQQRMEWSVLDAQKNPMPSRIKGWEVW